MNRTKGLLILFMAAGMEIFTACSNDEEMLWTQQSMEETVTEETVVEEKEDFRETEEEAVFSQTERLTVYVCGAVRQPGVYELDSQDRIVDAVTAAGGFAEDAATDYINLAARIQDGIKLMIPTQKQAEELQQDGQGILTEQFSPGSGTEAAGEQKVNINTADVTELCTLTGIGTAKAQSIIAYREEHGHFQKTTDIMNVTGIKEAGFAKIQDQITVK